MTNETETNRRGIFVPAVLPWLLGGGMFALYFMTLYHTASPASLDRLADVSGWDWRPKLFAPLTFLATYPIRWLPDHLKLPALNLFAAACASLTLLLLARSVALLPHDRTNEQRLREQSEFSLLTIKAAWLPPLFAVLVCGLQISFWERSVEFVDASFYDNGEMLNLLLFACLVRCLLEYRISRRESWLTRCALIFGLGMANDWALMGFFPAFVIALVWIKGFDFFHWRFVLRMLGCGLAGLCLLLLFPAIIGRQHFPGFGFGQALHYLLTNEKTALIHYNFDRKWFLVLSLTSILPLLLMGIRWTASFGDNSPLGIFLATSAMTLAHGFFLLCCLWVTLDPPFGPRQLLPPGPIHMPFLMVFYLGALSIGYFSGYFLLVFGSRSGKQRQRTLPLLRWFNRGVTVTVWLLAIAVPAALVARNLPRIQAGRSAAAAVDKYFSRVEQALPPRDVVIMSDVPAMLFDLQAALSRRQDRRNDVLIDTSSLSRSWHYLGFLDKQHPQDNPGAVLTDKSSPQPLEIDCIHLVEALATRHEIFYLHPSFGYYFERFYMQPDGLIYRLNEYPTNAWSPVPLLPAQVGKNLAFWAGASNDLVSLAAVIHPPPSPPPANAWERFRQAAFFAPETERVALELGQLYSRALNCWGVELQKSAGPGEDGKLREAGRCFDLAQQLFPENGPARFNLEFNRDLLQGTKPTPKPFRVLEEKLPGNYLRWYDFINRGGPFDEPNFRRELGILFRDGNNLRQAIQQFERMEALMPDDATAPLLLAQTRFLTARSSEVLNYAYPSPAQAYFDAASATDRALRLKPDETNALYLKTLCWLQLGGYLAVRTNETDRSYPSPAQAYSNSLAAGDHLLRLTPEEPNTLLFKVTALMQLKRFDESIPPLTRLIATQTNNEALFFSRAIARFQSGKLEAAKSDYEFVVKVDPRMFKAYYGLGEIAYTNKDLPEALRNYELYLTNTPDAWKESTEYKTVEVRVQELRNAPR